MSDIGRGDNTLSNYNVAEGDINGGYIIPFDDDIAGGYITRGGNIPCNGDIVGETTHHAMAMSMGGEVIFWETLEGKTLLGETLHCDLATLQGETLIGGGINWDRLHGVRGLRVRCHGRRQHTEQWWCLGGDINEGRCHGWRSCDVRHCRRRPCAEQLQCCRVGGRGEAVVHDREEREMGFKSKDRSRVYFGVLATLKKQSAYIKPRKRPPKLFLHDILWGASACVPPS